jgi:hypothetical protein
MLARIDTCFKINPKSMHGISGSNLHENNLICNLPAQVIPVPSEILKFRQAGKIVLLFNFQVPENIYSLPALCVHRL